MRRVHECQSLEKSTWVHVVPHFGCVTTQTSSGRTWWWRIISYVDFGWGFWIFEVKTLMFLTLWQWFAKLGVTRIISGFDLGSTHFVITITVQHIQNKQGSFLKKNLAQLQYKPDKLPAFSQLSITSFHGCVVLLREGNPGEWVFVRHSLPFQQRSFCSVWYCTSALVDWKTCWHWPQDREWNIMKRIAPLLKVKGH